MSTHQLLKSERGEAAMLSGVLLLAGVLVPLIMLISLFARVELAKLNVEQAARDAVRSAVLAPDATAASHAASEALEREHASRGVPLTLDLTGTYARGETMSASVSTSVPLGSLPLLGHFGNVSINARASAPVARYRSILNPAGAPP